MADDKQHRAMMEPIEREMRRKVNNSDEALIHRASLLANKIAMRGGPYPSTIQVDYHDGPFGLLQGPGGPGDMRASEECVRYFAIVAFEPDPNDVGRQIGRVSQKPADLDDKPNDPLVRWLIDETGAEPAKTRSIYRRLHQARIACLAAGAKAKEWRLSTSAHDEIIASPQCQSVITYEPHRSGKWMVMNLPVTFEESRPNITTVDVPDGDQIAVEPRESTVCIAAIGKRGRWEYFDA